MFAASRIHVAGSPVKITSSWPCSSKACSKARTDCTMNRMRCGPIRSKPWTDGANQRSSMIKTNAADSTFWAMACRAGLSSSLRSFRNQYSPRWIVDVIGIRCFPDGVLLFRGAPAVSRGPSYPTCGRPCRCGDCVPTCCDGAHGSPSTNC